MERISLSKLLAAVGFLICSTWTPVSFAQSSRSDDERYDRDYDRNGRNYGNTGRPRDEKEYNYGKQERSDVRLETREDRCEEDIKELKKAKAKFLSVCKKNGGNKSVGECSEILSDCQGIASGDFDVSPNQVLKQIMGAAMGLPEDTGSGGGLCSDYSYSDWKSDLKDLEQEKKDAEKDIRETKEKMAEAKKSLAEKQVGIAEKLHEMEEEKAEKELKEKEEARNIEKGKMESEASLKQKLRSIHLKIQQAQMAQAIAVESRKNDTKDAERAIKLCQKQALAEIQKSRSNTSNSLANRTASTKVVTGSLGAAKSAKKNRKQELADAMQDCVEKATEALNMARKRHQAEMKARADEIANANEEMKEIQKSIDLLAKHAAEAALDRANKQSKDEMNHERKKALKQHELSQLSSQYAENEARFGEAIYQANSSINQAQQKIGQHMTEKPKGKGSRSPREEIGEAQKEYVGLSCTTTCNGTKGHRECDELMGKSGKQFESEVLEGGGVK